MRLKAIKFTNYRAFKDATLPLQSLTLLIGANSTGKTSALSAIKTMANARGDGNIQDTSLVPIGIDGASDGSTELEAVWLDDHVTSFKMHRSTRFIDLGPDAHRSWLSTGRVFELDPARIAGNVPLTKTLELE